MRVRQSGPIRIGLASVTSTTRLQLAQANMASNATASTLESLGILVGFGCFCAAPCIRAKPSEDGVEHCTE